MNLDKQPIAIKGNAILADKILYNAVIMIEGGKISGIFEDKASVMTDEIFDAGSGFIIPGCVDAHVHCFSAPDEGFENAGYAAAAGGVTTIVEMPYDAAGMICTTELFIKKKEKLAKESVVDTAMLATIKKRDGLDQIPLLAKEGACGFKISMFNTNSVRFPRIDDAEMMDIFYTVAATGLPVGVHAENDEIVRKHLQKYQNEGLYDPKAHCRSRPPVAESTAVLTALEMAYWSGAKLHIYHCTFPRIFELAQFFRSEGVKVTTETCPHYLTFDEEDMVALKARGKINPPLRGKAEVNGLWEKVSSGAVDIITSDHAPWKMELKNSPDIFANASGAPGVETLLPVIYTEGVASGRITLHEMVKYLCENPAAIFGLSHCKGRIAVGMDADLVVIDPNKYYVLDERRLHSTAGWSPYHGRKLRGGITHTFLRGRLIYNEEMLVTPGYGRLVTPIQETER